MAPTEQAGGSYKQTIPVKTTSHEQMVNITAEVQRLLPRGTHGVCSIFCSHTTAGLTVNENADPDVTEDILLGLREAFPWENVRYKHMEGNSAAHIKASVLGPDLFLPVIDGRLDLGTWQAVFFCEFDGPRSRKVSVQLLANPATSGQ